MIKTSVKGISSFVYQKQNLFKQFKETNKFVQRINEIESILEKYLVLKNSSLSLHCFKDNLKTTKEVCNESSTEFR